MTTALIQQAADAARAGDLVAALDKLLEAWRDSPAAPLAEAIEALGAAVATDRDAVAGKKPEATDRWRELATQKRARDLDPLLETWLDVPTKLATERVELLSAWPADPRRDQALVRVLELIPYKTSRKVWGRLFAMIKLVRDPRVLPRLQALKQIYYEQWIADTGYWAQDKLEAIVPEVAPALADAASAALPDGADALLAAITDAVQPTASDARDTEDEQALLDEVLAAPHDDDARRVYGDLLARRGHPRGELISLQLLDKLDAAQRKRVKALVRDNLEALAGPLAHVLRRGGLTFERGFLHTCVVDSEKENLIAEVIGHPLWATVEDLDSPVSIAEHPVMRSLTTLRAMQSMETPKLWAADAPALPTVRSLHCWAYDPETLASLGATERFPALEHLHVHWIDPSGHDVPADPSNLLVSPLAQRLSRLDVTLRAWRLWHEALQQHRCPVPTITLTQQRFHELVFERDDDGRHSALTLRFKLATDKNRESVEQRALDTLIALFDGVDPASLSSLRLEPQRRISDDARTRINEALAPFAALAPGDAVL